MADQQYDIIDPKEAKEAKEAQLAKKKEKNKPKGSPQQREHQMVTLRGLVPRPQTFNLSHDEYCRTLGQCHCTDQPLVTSKLDPHTGQSVFLQKTVRIPPSITVFYKTSTTVFAAALKCPEIEGALGDRPMRIKVER